MNCCAFARVLVDPSREGHFARLRPCRKSPSTQRFNRICLDGLSVHRLTVKFQLRRIHRNVGNVPGHLDHECCAKFALIDARRGRQTRHGRFHKRARAFRQRAFAAACTSQPDRHCQVPCADMFMHWPTARVTPRPRNGIGLNEMSVITSSHLKPSLNEGESDKPSCAQTEYRSPLKVQDAEHIIF